mgnify:CR=1 FL=1
MSIINGNSIHRKLDLNDIKNLGVNIKKDFCISCDLKIQEILEMIIRFPKKITDSEINNLLKCLVDMGFDEKYSKKVILFAFNCFSKEYIFKRFENEFKTYSPFEEEKKNCYITEQFVPLGILFHITASTSPISPLISLLEGLLTGNVNVLKISSRGNMFLEKFIELFLKYNPYLKKYIHVLDIPSCEKTMIKEMISIADGVVVWGADKTVNDIKKMTSPNQKLIIWGHKISFAYISHKNIYNKNDLENICADICVSNQLACNAPQNILVETSCKEDLIEITKLLDQCMKKISKHYGYIQPDIHEQSEITTQVMLAKSYQILGEKFVIEGENNDWNIITSFEYGFKPSPLFRTVLIFPVNKNEVIKQLFPMRNYLQTAIVSCKNDELNDIKKILFHAGVTKICRPGNSHNIYFGEPHDGVYSLRCLVKRVSANLE